MAAGARGPRYCAARPELLRLEPLDRVLTAAYHRPSGTTHLLAEPAPEILAALAGDGLDEAGLLAALAERFDLAGADASALAVRLAELAAAGLVEAVPA